MTCNGLQTAPVKRTSTNAEWLALHALLTRRLRRKCRLRRK